MARLYPPDIPDSAPYSEQRVLELIAEQLDDEYTAIWSIDTLSRDDLGEIVMGEADVVLIHPRRGLLVLEVKGGSIRYDGSRRCYRSTDSFGADHPIKDPYDQAQRRARDLARRIEGLGLPGTRRGEIPCVWGYGVVFPDCEVGQERLPPNALREITLDSRDLDFLKSRIERIYHHWAAGRQSRDLTPEELKAILGRVLMPDFRLAFSLSSEMYDGHRRILKLTEDQFNILDALEDTPRALIRGAAGTGKTFLLMEKARRLSEDGRSALALCYNRPLAEHLERWCADTGVDADVYTFHHLCRLVIEHAGWKFEPPEGEGAEYFWKVEAPNRMFELLDGYPKRWDAVLVDEGQDFDAAWWTCVEGTLADPEGLLHIFFDPNQRIFDVAEGFPFDRPRFPLKTNCRNTKNICRLIKASVPEYEARVPDSAPVGRIPCFLRADGKGGPLQQIDRLVDHLVARESIKPSQIMILSPHSFVHSALAGRAKAGKYRLVQMQDRSDDAVTFSSLSRFKGLESDVVIVIDVEGEIPGASDRRLHIAFSRAAQLLYVLHEPDYTSPRVEYEPESRPSPLP